MWYRKDKESEKICGDLIMKTVLSSFVVLFVLLYSTALLNASNPEVDLKQTEITTTANEADEWLTKGNTAYEAKNYDEAITCYKKATELDPGFASAYYNLAIIYAAKGMLEEAISAYKKALTVKPDYYAARNNLATIYIKKGLCDEAIAELKQVLDSNPDLPQAHFNLGECYFTKGNTSLAADHYYKAGVLFVDRGDKDWAQKSYDSLKKTNIEKLEKSLLEKMNEEEQQKSMLDERIEIDKKKGD
jgi:tetratricopeptide (TPR) repeat protein